MGDLAFACFITALVVFVTGWVAAHNTVASECEKLGAFYVGDKVYVCKRKEATNG